MLLILWSTLYLPQSIRKSKIDFQENKESTKELKHLFFHFMPKYNEPMNGGKRDLLYKEKAQIQVKKKGRHSER